MNDYGKKTWLIADCYYPSKSTDSKSHDAICVLNTSNTVANIKITLYFENQDKLEGFSAVCGAERTLHIRMDKIVGENGIVVPTDTPYAALVESDTEIICQYSRLDTSCGGMALMTTIAYHAK